MSEQQNLEVARAQIEAMSAGDIDRFKSTLAENCVLDSDSWGGTVEGKEAAGQLIQGYVDAFAPTLTIEQEVASGDTVILFYSYNGTHNGEFAGLAPTGNTATGRVIVISQFNDGLVESSLAAFDNASLGRDGASSAFASGSDAGASSSGEASSASANGSKPLSHSCKPA